MPQKKPPKNSNTAAFVGMPHSSNELMISARALLVDMLNDTFCSSKLFFHTGARSVKLTIDY